MELKLDLYSTVGIAFCGIYYALDKFNNFINKAKHYIKSNQGGEIGFPLSDLRVDVKLIYHNICYPIQIVLISPNNDFAVISGDGYSIFKIMKSGKKYFHISWNGESYNIHMTKRSNTFNLTINDTNIMSVTRSDDTRLNSALLEFPANVNTPSDNSNSVLDTCLSDLNNILMGYNLPEPFFVNDLNYKLDRIFKFLLNPLLPFFKFQNFLDNNGALLTPGLVTQLKQIIGQYTLNFSSLFSKFPSDLIKTLIEKHLDNIQDTSRRLSMDGTLRPIMEMAEMFSGGIRGNVKYVVEKLLLDYLRVEIKFNDEEGCKHVINQLKLADLISHNNLTNKNKLILTLFEFLDKFLPGIISDLKSTIERVLCSLNGQSYSQIIAKLREVLITGQIPSYEVRKNEMEALFLTSIIGYNSLVQTSRLEHLICSNSEVFDIISDFFYHKMVEVRKCAMEVYIRRAYMIYEISSVEQSQLANGQLCVLFQFILPGNLAGSCSNGYEKKRSNSYVTPLNNSKTIMPRKSLQACRSSGTNGNIEKEDISDFELPNEDEYLTVLSRQKSIDCDTDSAISIGACSLSELSATVSDHVDSDGLNDANGVRHRHSPSTQSLDRGLPSSNYSSVKDTTDSIKVSNGSLDRYVSYRQNRHTSMFCNNPPTIQVQDYFGNCGLGVMIIFETMEELEINLSSVQDLITNRHPLMESMDYRNYDVCDPNISLSPATTVVLKMILRDPHLVTKSDSEVSTVFVDFCDKHASFFEASHVSRTTFLLQAMDKTIRYFTLRKRYHFEEDIKFRNIDPILSFQLEINRLRNYHLERLPVPNRMMYVYMGKCKEMTMSVTTEYRMFIRCIIHHKDFNSSTSNVNYMAKEAERNLTEAMDAFDMACVDERSQLTKSNHIFFYFHSILCINKIEELENVVRAIIFKNGRRLWSLRITQAELKMSVKLTDGSLVPIRLWVHNEGGKSLDICIYREEIQFKTDHKVLVSWSSGKEGRYHGVPVDCFYMI